MPTWNAGRWRKSAARALSGATRLREDTPREGPSVPGGRSKAARRRKAQDAAARGPISRLRDGGPSETDVRRRLAVAAGETRPLDAEPPRPPRAPRRRRRFPRSRGSPGGHARTPRAKAAPAAPAASLAREEPRGAREGMARPAAAGTRRQSGGAARAADARAEGAHRLGCAREIERRPRMPLSTGAAIRRGGPRGA